MDIYEKARELGDLISESDELKKLRDAEETIINNQQALDIFNEFSSIRQEYANLMEGTDDQSKLEDVKTRLLAKNEEIMKNETTKNYIDSKTAVDNIFKSVTDILMKAVNGSDEESGGCSTSDCSGCGGGCH